MAIQKHKIRGFPEGFISKDDINTTDVTPKAVSDILNVEINDPQMALRTSDGLTEVFATPNARNVAIRRFSVERPEFKELICLIQEDAGTYKIYIRPYWDGSDWIDDWSELTKPPAEDSMSQYTTAGSDIDERFITFSEIDGALRISFGKYKRPLILQYVDNTFFPNSGTPVVVNEFILDYQCHFAPVDADGSLGHSAVTPIERFGVSYNAQAASAGTLPNGFYLINLLLTYDGQKILMNQAYSEGEGGTKASGTADFASAVQDDTIFTGDFTYTFNTTATVSSERLTNRYFQTGEELSTLIEYYETVISVVTLTTTTIEVEYYKASASGNDYVWDTDAPARITMSGAGTLSGGVDGTPSGGGVIEIDTGIIPHRRARVELLVEKQYFTPRLQRIEVFIGEYDKNAFGGGFHSPEKQYLAKTVEITEDGWTDIGDYYRQVVDIFVIADYWQTMIQVLTRQTYFDTRVRYSLQTFLRGRLFVTNTREIPFSLAPPPACLQYYDVGVVGSYSDLFIDDFDRFYLLGSDDNEGNKVLRNGILSHYHWVNNKLGGIAPDYEVVLSHDSHGSLSSDIRMGVMFSVRVPGLTGNTLWGEGTVIRVTLRGNNRVYVDRHVFSPTWGDVTFPILDEAFTWTAGTKYRMRVQVEMDMMFDRDILRVWIWEDGTSMPGTETIYDTSTAKIYRGAGYIGIIGQKVSDCDRSYLHEEQLHLIAFPFSTWNQWVAIQFQKSFGFPEQWLSITARGGLIRHHLELGHYGQRKVSGYLSYEPGLINVDKPIESFIAEGSTNFSEYWTGAQHNIVTANPSDFSIPWERTTDIFEIIKEEDEYRHLGGVVIEHTASDTTHWRGFLYEKVGVKGDFEALALMKTVAGLTVGGIVIRVDDTSPNPLCYIIKYRDYSNNDFLLQKHANNWQPTILASYTPNRNLLETYEGVYIRVRAVGNNIKAKIWGTLDEEPSVWHIDYTDASSPILSGKIGLANSWNRTYPSAPSNISLRAYGLAWSDSFNAQFPSNTLARWGGNISQYGYLGMQFALTDSTDIPDDNLFLNAKRWGIIPSVNWVLGTGGASKYLHGRLLLSRDTCDELSPVGGDFTETIIEGDLCSTQLDDNVEYRFRQRVCVISGNTSWLRTFESFFGSLDYKFDLFHKDGISLDKMREYSCIIYIPETPEAVGDNTFSDKFKTVISEGIPVIFGSSNYSAGTEHVVTRVGVAASSGYVSGSIGEPEIISKKYGGLTDPFTLGDIVRPHHSSYSGYIDTTQPYVGEVLLRTLPHSVSSDRLLAVEKGTLNLDSVALNARIVCAGWLYPTSSLPKTAIGFLQRSIDWCLETGKDINNNPLLNISGVIVDESDTPISGQLVRLYTLGLGAVVRETTTDGSGNFTFELLEQNTFIIVSAKDIVDGYYPIQEMVTLESNDVNVGNLKFELISYPLIINFDDYEIVDTLPFNPDLWDTLDSGEPSHISIQDLGTEKGIVINQPDTGIFSLYKYLDRIQFEIDESQVSPVFRNDYRVRWRFNFATHSANLRVWLPVRCEANNTMYYFGYRGDTNRLEIARYRLGSYSSLTNTVIGVLDADEDYYLEGEVYNNVSDNVVLSVKLWKVGDAEPGSWTLTNTQTSLKIMSGGFGVGGRGEIVRIKEIQVIA
jgi:hypothetical protein